MGCDIHSFIEVRRNGRWELLQDGGVTPEEWERTYDKVSKSLHPFSWRSYGSFAFLAGVRNYSAVPTIREPRGLPMDASDGVRQEYERWDTDAHTPSWLTAAELSAWDYDSAVEDRRVTRNNDGGCTAEPGGGEMMTWRKFLGPIFMQQVEDLKAIGNPNDVRVVFWFDN